MSYGSGGRTRTEVRKILLLMDCGLLKFMLDLVVARNCLKILFGLVNTLLYKFQPDVCFLLDFQKYCSVFGHFNLFMCTRGTSNMHVDRTDLLAFLFLISVDENCGGGLELGGSGHFVLGKLEIVLSLIPLRFTMARGCLQLFGWYFHSTNVIPPCSSYSNGRLC